MFSQWSAIDFQKGTNYYYIQQHIWSQNNYSKEKKSDTNELNYLIEFIWNCRTAKTNLHCEKKEKKSGWFSGAVEEYTAKGHEAHIYIYFLEWR